MKLTHQRGFSLLEVLIAWALTMSLLVILVKSDQQAKILIEVAYYRSIAAIQLVSLLDRLRTNQDSPFRMREFTIWNKENQQLLPKGNGHYSCLHHHCQLKITWMITNEQHTMAIDSTL